MGQLKVATYNIEWMLALFGALPDAQWRATPKIPKRFGGSARGGIRLAPIGDVHALCRRIAEGIRAVDADMLFVQEGPPLAEQMQLFVDSFLDGAYVVHRSNRSNQAVYALVRRSIAGRFRVWHRPGRTPRSCGATSRTTRGAQSPNANAAPTTWTATR